MVGPSAHDSNAVVSAQRQATGKRGVLVRLRDVIRVGARSAEGSPRSLHRDAVAPTGRPIPGPQSGEIGVVRRSTSPASFRLGLCDPRKVMTGEELGDLKRDLSALARSRREDEAEAGNVKL